MMPLTRKADQTDIRDIFDWRNDSDTRLMSLSTEKVSWDKHQSWFEKAICDSDLLLLMAVSTELVTPKIGIVRFNFQTDGQASEISINLNPATRGLGLATPVLFASLRFLEENYRTMPLYARIRPENIASRRAFEKTGFMYDKSEATYDLFLRPE